MLSGPPSSLTTSPHLCWLALDNVFAANHTCNALIAETTARVATSCINILVLITRREHITAPVTLLGRNHPNLPTLDALALTASFRKRPSTTPAKDVIQQPGLSLIDACQIPLPTTSPSDTCYTSPNHPWEITMKTRTTTIVGATIALAAITVAAPTADASTHTYSNQKGDVRCEIYNTPQDHTTLYVSGKARKASPSATRRRHSFLR
ncbi:hypothetical protein [Corynebacterium pseudogenitalium]|uniref:hypothetical protein n=1 Tax=Corynebacterium pseudogenitalium TaxID=38303 RepID=UPI002108F6A3|nr:hypothetical protein [Corynebacterium pseudogenitalium]MCQ4607502.1 hypothetical protein [Corynebacterium pseudogenitalium]